VAGGNEQDDEFKGDETRESVGTLGSNNNGVEDDLNQTIKGAREWNMDGWRVGKLHEKAHNLIDSLTTATTITSISKLSM